MDNKQYTHDALVKTALKRPGVKKAYDELEQEFLILEELVRARKQSGKTQREVAEIMGTTTSTVGRLESMGGKTSLHSPSFSTLCRYAKAVGCRLQLKLLPLNDKS